MSDLTAAHRFRYAFDEVILAYINCKAVDGLINQFTARWEQEYNPRLRVQPSMQDFIVDVELAMEATFKSPEEFMQLWLTMMGTSDTFVADKVKQSLGFVFMIRNIYPLSAYMVGKDMAREV